MIKKVLIAEDSITMQRIILNICKNMFEEVESATDGEDAFIKAKVNQYDLVLTDWNMPKMSGEELVQKLREMDNYKNVPIMMITTRGKKADVIRALDIGVNGYIVKPFTPDQVKMKIEKVTAAMG